MTVAAAAARLASWIEAAIGWLCAAILAAMLAIVLAAVVLRYGFNQGLLGAEELGIWLHVALVAFGAPLAVTSTLAMRLDIAVRLLPSRVQAVCAVLADGIAVAAALLLLLGGAAVAGAIGGVSTTLGLPESLRSAAIAIGGGLTILLLMLRLLAAEPAIRAAATLAVGVALYLACHTLRAPALATPSLAAAIVAGLGLLVGAPLPHALLFGVFAAIPFGGLLPEPALVQTGIAGIGKFLLLAIPFFLLAGGLLTVGGLAERLVAFAAALVGHRRGGLAQTTLLTSVMFSGASGSSIANAAFGAKVMVPALTAHGYAVPRAAAIVAATSMLDNIIPPSIAFLILAAATNLSVGGLLTGGFVAGGMLALALGFAIHMTSRGERVLRNKATAEERWRAGWQAVPAIGLGIVVVVGIRFGVVTTTEASALAVAYALVVGVAMRALTGRALAQAFRQSAVEAAAIGLLIGSAAPFAFLLAVDRVADAVNAAVTLLGGGALAVMLLANVVLLVAGLVLDIGAAILLLAPLLLPAAVAAGIDATQFGVILVVNLMIHGLTPPLGVLVYVTAGISGARPAAVFREALPFLAALLIALAVMAAGAALYPLLR